MAHFSKIMDRCTYQGMRHRSLALNGMRYLPVCVMHQYIKHLLLLGFLTNHLGTKIWLLRRTYTHNISTWHYVGINIHKNKNKTYDPQLM